MKKLLGLLAVAPLAITSCGGGSGSGVKAKTVTTVVAEGTVTDGTFNQSVDEGAKAVKSSLGLTVSNVELNSGDAEKLKTGIVNQLENNIETVLLPGFTHGTKQLDELATAYDDRNFILFDSNGYFDDSGFNAYNNPRIASVLYDIHQAAFLAGYFTAKFFDDQNKQLKFGTFGGMKFPSVYSFMAGAKQGIAAFNSSTGANMTNHEVVSLGSSPDDYYSGSFAPGEGTAKSTALLTQGANVIMPVAGPQTQDAINAIKNSGDTTDKYVIGVDVDATALYSSDSALILTSVTKGLNASTQRILKELYSGTPDRKSFGTTTTGNLDNDEVGIVYNSNIKDTWMTDAIKLLAKGATATDSQFA